MRCFVNCEMFLGKAKISDDSFVLDSMKSIANEENYLIYSIFTLKETIVY